ncbi:class I SAM-dependent methyltransferase [Camelliibacillus cellulosilyticus]|uniref:Class I SAM-dependent methyltransferase n=1 Tax=Camelliibacillus cellulosilyticus TaxID=2174486 RepID=A0ABV9GIK7_9BACL
MNLHKKIHIFNRQAKQYERQAEHQTLGVWRKQLLSSARGNILELAVGAGNNFPFYPPGAEVTAVDFSPLMLEKAKKIAAM